MIAPLILIALAGAPPMPVPDARPIMVTGRPWAPFISPMGEPFRAHSATDDTLADWFRQADRNQDGTLTADEMDSDAQRFFIVLDTNHDGEIDPEELANYEYEIAPDVQLMSRTRPMPGEKTAKMHSTDSAELAPDDPPRKRGRNDRFEPGGLQGGARYGLLNIPEPVASADADFNRGVSIEEFRAAALRRFQLLDEQHSGSITLERLETLRANMLAGRRAKTHESDPDRRVGNGLPSGQ